MVSFPISSSRGSASRHETPDSRVGSPSIGPSRLSKSEVLHYQHIIAGLESEDNNRFDLSWRLSQPPETPKENKRELPSNGDDRDKQAAEVDSQSDNDDLGTESEYQDEGSQDDIEDDDEGTDLDRPRWKSTSVSTAKDKSRSRDKSQKFRRIDGPAFTPSYQDNNQPSKKRKRSEKLKVNDERESMKWPITINQFKQKKEKIDTLEESIKIFISSYIRLNGLKAPFSRDNFKKNSISNDNQRSNANASTDENLLFDEEFDDELENNLPENLIESSKELINTILIDLAITRPSGMGTKRKYMNGMNWNDLLVTSSMTGELQPTIRKTNDRLREMYKVENSDILSHRLEVVHSTKRESEPSILDSLYDSILPKKNTATRPHQSQKELHQRAEKRRLKQEAKLANMAQQTETSQRHPDQKLPQASTIKRKRK
ncbi:uncharacterized protein L201_001949 [Kwoniella dendrophila CBS 6074]|uniref:Rrn9 domain-containing protein n=1 Tax=Kwoniella dendrophila CBS 6074 TaxID=1295534 RepID=A0AAX4JQB0_9TREE